MYFLAVSIDRLQDSKRLATELVIACLTTVKALIAISQGPQAVGVLSMTNDLRTPAHSPLSESSYTTGHATVAGPVQASELAYI